MIRRYKKRSHISDKKIREIIKCFFLYLTAINKYFDRFRTIIYYMYNLKDVMKEIRKERKIQAKQMAIGLGISPAYLVLIEKGERIVPLDFFNKVNVLCALTENELVKLSESVMSHPLNDKNARQRSRINAVLQTVLQIANGIFTRLMSQLKFDRESEGKLQSLIEILQNLQAKIFNNTANELENRLI
ncbi:MAG: transcriptional regulator with XRE-family HTH domain [Candidatus Deianiraeaceae bacterium]|jgi:transcriptional regulator with XRE-family HTH domain